VLVNRPAPRRQGLLRAERPDSGMGATARENTEEEPITSRGYEARRPEVGNRSINDRCRSIQWMASAERREATA
jgi:hypothetical protein